MTSRFSPSSRTSRPGRGRARFLSATLAAILLADVATPAAARAAGDETSVHAVEDLTNQAYEQATAGKYAEAIATYMKAYEVSKAGAILFNIATIYDRKLHERTLAIEYFRRYLQATDADPDFARKATERLSALKAEAAAEEQVRTSVHVAVPPPAPVLAAPPPPSPAPSHGSTLRTVGFVFGGLGLVGMGTALALGAVAKSRNDDANAYCGATSCSSSQGVALEHQAGDFATAATATFVAGGVLFVTGLTLVLAAPRADGASSASIAITPRVGPSSGGLSIEGRF